jgi:hypothetical protein
LDLRISDKKTRFQPINKGIDFLGYFVKPSHILVRQKVIGRLKKKLMFYTKLSKISKKELVSILAKINSYFGHFCHADSYNLRKHLYGNHLGALQRIFLPKTNYFCLRYVK